MLIIFQEAVMPKVADYAKILEKIYVFTRSLNNLTTRGFTEAGPGLQEEIREIVQQLNPYQLLRSKQKNMIL